MVEPELLVMLQRHLAAGASTVMYKWHVRWKLNESPGSTITKNGKRYKFYSGMASLGAARRRKSKENNTN